MFKKWVAMGVWALVVSPIGCSSDDDQAETRAGIAEVCDNGTACAEGLFCFQGVSQLEHQLSGLCTVTCDTRADCMPFGPNLSCFTSGVCGHLCGNGLSCPIGTHCNINDVCIHYD